MRRVKVLGRGGAKIRRPHGKKAHAHTGNPLSLFLFFSFFLLIREDDRGEESEAPAASAMRRGRDEIDVEVALVDDSDDDGTAVAGWRWRRLMATACALGALGLCAWTLGLAAISIGARSHAYVLAWGAFAVLGAGLLWRCMARRSQPQLRRRRPGRPRCCALQ